MESRKQDWWNWGLLLWGFLLFVPMFGQYWQNTIKLDFYKWLPAAVVGVTVLTMRALRQAEPATKVLPAWIQVGWWGIALCGLFFGYLYNTPWLGIIAFVFWMGLVFVQWSSTRKGALFFGLWALLWLVCRFPGQLELRLLSVSSGFAARVASPVVDALGVLNVVQGEVMKVGEKEIDITLVTDNYFTIFSVLAVAAFLAYFRQRSLWHVLLLISSAFAVATVVNAMRVSVAAVALAEWDMDLMQGIERYVLLALSYGLSLLLLLSVDALLVFILQEVEEPSGRLGKKVIRLWNRLVSFRLSGFLSRWWIDADAKPTATYVTRGFVLVGLVGMSAFVGIVKTANRDYLTSEQQMHERESLAIIDPELMQFTRPGWKLVKVESEERPFDSIWGAFSFIWRLEYYDTTVIMALDYPFHQWHDVKACYGNLGWSEESSRIERFEQRGGWPASETEMVLPTGDYGFILCSHSDHLGAAVEPKPADTGLTLLKYKFGRNKWVAPFGVVDDKDKNTFYQTQVMVTTGFPLDDATKQEIRMMYVEFREQTRVLIQQKSKQQREGGAHD